MLAMVRACRDRALLATGEARWIWCSRDIRGPSRVRFYATRDFVLQEVPRRAVAKVFVDRRWELFINGSRVAAGEQRPGDPMEILEIASYLKRGSNRVAIQAESPTGVGGILFSLDLDARENAVVSDAGWRVDSSDAAILRGGRAPAVEWGRPPIHPWGYPALPEPTAARRPPR